MTRRSMNANELSKVDNAAIKTNQATIIILNIVAFILDAPWLAGIVSLVMIIGTVLKSPGFKLIYRTLKSAGLIKPDMIMDNPEPHRFAQGFGGVVMFAGSSALFAGATTLGWGLVWLVAALAALNFFGGFCMGCALYYWLGRFKISGFTKSPSKGTFPGMRSKTKVGYGD